MLLMLIFLHREEYLEDILTILVELGARSTTILESHSLGEFLAFEVPIFAGLRQLMGEKRAPSKTIIALLEDPNHFNRFQRLMEEQDIDFTQPGTGTLVTLPVDEVISSMEELQE
jgi:hypothetical protein